MLGVYQNSVQLHLFPYLTVPTASLPGSNSSPGHCQMVQRPEWLRLHQQVSKGLGEGRGEGWMGVLPPDPWDWTASHSHRYPAKARGCTVQLTLVESL